MNFASYRQAELDNQRISTFTQLSAVPHVSKRYALMRFLGLTEEEMAENERLWREENDENLTKPPTDSQSEMRGAGISGAGIEADIGGATDVAPEGEDPTVAAGATDTTGAPTGDTAVGGAPAGETPPA